MSENRKITKLEYVAGFCLLLPALVGLIGFIGVLVPVLRDFRVVDWVSIILFIMFMVGFMISISLSEKKRRI